MYDSGESVCSNRTRIDRQALEESVLSGLQTHLMHPPLVEASIREFQSEVTRAAGQAGANMRRAQKELSKIERELKNMVTAIEKGLRTATTTLTELQRLEARKAELKELAKASAPPPVAVRPNLAESTFAKS
jgi:site-specific DNA recombinase